MSSYNKKYTALVVEDEEMERELLQEILEEAGYECTLLESGEAAVEIMEHDTAKFDIFLIDIKLSGLSGLEVARRVKEEFYTEDYRPVIMVSSLREDDNKVSGLEYADDYITKPFSEEVLLARMRSLLRIKDLQEELKKSREKYYNLFDNMPYMSVTLDENKRIQEYNSNFKRELLSEKGSVQGTEFLEMFKENNREDIDRYIEKLRDFRGHTEEHNTSMTDMEGEEIEVKMRGVSAVLETGTLCFLIVIEDVTRDQRLEREKNEAIEQVYRSSEMASVGNLASGISHELTNPLSSVLGFSEALYARINSDKTFKENYEEGYEELKEYLGYICSEAVKCQKICRNLSNYVSKTGNPVKNFSVRQLVESSMYIVRTQASSKSITLSNLIPSDFFIDSDPHRINQALINILENSIEFTDKGGEVRVSAERDNRYARVTVTDNGCGMDEDIIDKAFKPFFTTREDRLGMGLPLSLRSIEELNGDILIESEYGEGTKTMIEIPLE